MDQIEQQLQAFLPFWDHLDTQQREALAAGAHTARFEAGAHVHSGENDCIGVLMVLSGNLRAYMLSSTGRECTLFHVRTGESCVLAATCILQMITFDMFLDAEDACELIVLNPEVYARIVEENLAAEAFTYRQTADRFSDVMWVMQQQLFMGLDGRLAVLLLDEVAHCKSDVLELTHEEIARHIGSAREAVSRMLKSFSDDGIVVLSRGKIEVRDKAALRQMTSL